MKRHFFCCLFFVLTLTAYSQMQKTVTVFTTANNTNYRITKTDSGLKFSDFGQPLETQVCVFVDPTHSFQTLLGIGGAITDASAETFAKLPGRIQKQLLTATMIK
jgi:glucosylceramidase